MDNFDRRIRDRLLAVPPGWEARAADMKEGVRAMYEERMKKAAQQNSCMNVAAESIISALKWMILRKC